MSRIVKTDDDNIITGRNSVLELLNSNREIDRILVEKGNKTGSMSAIIAKAGQKQIPVKYVVAEKLNSICPGANHQGVIAIVTPYKYFTVEEILKDAKDKNEDPFIVILDEIEDPHNLGAILRSADATGADAIIIPKNRSVSLNQTVAKVSTGAIEYVDVVQVTNLTQTIQELKKQGYWIIGLELDGSIYYDEQDYKGNVAIVVGSEGKGISRLVKENCDVLVKIPMYGKVNSLNASVSAGLILYEVVRNRNK